MHQNRITYWILKLESIGLVFESERCLELHHHQLASIRNCAGMKTTSHASWKSDRKAYRIEASNCTQGKIEADYETGCEDLKQRVKVEEE